MPFYQLEGQELTKEFQDNPVTRDMSVKQSVKLRKTSVESENVCSLMPGSQLLDKEFQRFFFQPAYKPDPTVAVNNTLVSSLKVAEAKVIELQNAFEKLKLENVAVQKHLSDEADQAKETSEFPYKHEQPASLYYGP